MKEENKARLDAAIKQLELVLEKNHTEFAGSSKYFVISALSALENAKENLEE